MFNNEKYYLEATKEFESGKLDEALWSKMLFVYQGDETKAKYSYIKQRVKEIQKEASRKSFSNNLGNFKKLIKRMIRPFFILVVAALIIFGIIKTIDYIQTRAEEAAYQQQAEEQAAADAIARAERKKQEELDKEKYREKLKEIEEEDLKREQAIANAYQGLDCVVRIVRVIFGVKNDFPDIYNFSIIINPILPSVEGVEYTLDMFPKFVVGNIDDYETYFNIDLDSEWVGKPSATASKRGLWGTRGDGWFCKVDQPIQIFEFH